MKKMNGAKLLIRTLEENGVEYIFGVPGDIENEFFKELSYSNIEFFNVMHEQSGAMMADVYSRLTGKIGVCFSTLGPGATNMLTGIANANQDRSSVLAISGQLPLNEQYRDSHQYIDLVDLYKPVTKSSFMIYRAKDINSKVNNAIDLTQTEKKGPVHISLPIDVLSEEVKTFRTIKNTRKISFDYTLQLRNLSELVNKSNSIVAIIGNGVVRTNNGQRLQQFVEKLNIPFYTSFQSKGVIPHKHYLNCGVLSRHSEKIKEILGKQDLIITFGYDIIEGVTQNIWDGAKNVVHIDNDVPSGDYMTYNPDIEVVGDIGLIVDDYLKEFELKRELPKITENLESMKITTTPPDGFDDLFPLHPAKVMKDLREVLGDEDIVISDVGLHKQAIGLYYEVNKPNQVIFSNGLSTMGFAIPSTLAAKVVHPNKKIVGICGDGGFQMNIQELATAVENELPIVYIIMNDSAYGMVKNKQLETTGVHYAAEFTRDRNFSEIANGFGALGFKIKQIEDLIPTLNEAFNSNKVCVIDIPIQQYSDIKMMK
jgi:acetolactate synthase-1/2/3 large subunit